MNDIHDENCQPAWSNQENLLNFSPPSKQKSILKPSNQINILPLTPEAAKSQKSKVTFQTPAQTPGKKVTPNRYTGIKQLDEEENWIERTSVITKEDHVEYVKIAQDLVEDLISKLPIDESKPDINPTENLQEPVEEVKLNENIPIKESVANTENCAVEDLPLVGLTVENSPEGPQQQQKDPDTLQESSTEQQTENRLETTPQKESSLPVKTEPANAEPLAEGKVNPPASPKIMEENQEEEIPIPKGTYNLDFLDNLDENTNPFETKTKIMANSPTTKAPPVDNSSALNGEEIDPFKSKTALANSPQLPRKQMSPAKEVVDNDTTEEPTEADKENNSTNDEVNEQVPSPEKIDQNSNTSKKTPAKQKASPKTEEKVKPPSPPKNNDENQEEEIPVPKGSYNLDFLDNLDENINPFETKTKIIANSPTTKAPPVEINEEIDPFKPKAALANSPPTQRKQVSPKQNNVASEENHSANVEANKQVPSPENTDQNSNTPKKTEAKKTVRPKFKRPPKVAKGNGEGDEIEIFMPGEKKSSNDQMQDADNTALNNQEQPSQGALNSIDNAISESAPMESTAQESAEIAMSVPEGERQANSEKNANLHSNLLNSESADKIVENMNSVDEMATSVDLQSDVADPAEDFVSGTEVFNDPAAWDMLEKFGGNTELKDSDLARQSLYVKFDPLVKGAQSPALVGKRKTAKPPVIQESINEDTFLLMGTPPANKGKLKHPASRALEEQILQGETNEDRTVDMLLGSSILETKEDSQKINACEANVNKPSTEAAMTGETGIDIVQVLKYSQTDLNRMKKEWELDYQAKFLAKEREWLKKYEEKERDKTQAEEQVKQSKKEMEVMKNIVSEYETTITQLIAEKENQTSVSKETLEELTNERNQALDDLQSVENAFSDLHRRYEKSKSLNDGLVKNEEVLKKCVADYQQKLKKQEQKYEALKQNAERKLDEANNEIEKIRKGNTEEVARIKGALKKAELTVNSQQQTIEQKIKENKELTAICDELLYPKAEEN